MLVLQVVAAVRLHRSVNGPTPRWQLTSVWARDAQYGR